MTKPNPVLRNIIANYASQLYVIALGLAVVPLYIKYMGIEAFGLIGFFAMLQTWMTLFDLGLGPAFGREASKFRAGKISAGALNLFLQTIERTFFALGASIVLIGWMSGEWVATEWLKLDVVHRQDTSTSIVLVGVIFSMRLMSGVYRNGLLGLENQVQANVILTIVATLRSALVLPILIWVSASLLTFFSFQIFAAIVETWLLKLALGKSLPDHRIEKFQWIILKEPLRFGGGAALLAWVWIATSQVDKLILSHLLSLKEYAGYILATTVAFGVYSLISPLQQAILPRLVILSEQNKHHQFMSLYRLTSMLLVAVVAGVAGAIVAYPEQVLYAWTGDLPLAAQVAQVLKWYAAGTGFMAIAGMGYVLQNAKGDLRLHINSNIVSLLFFVPLLIVSTLHFGAIGAAMAWAAINLFFLTIWTTFVHKKFLPELTARWLLVDIGPGVGVAALIVIAAQFTNWPFTGRMASLAALVSLATGIAGAVLMIHRETRKLVCEQFQRMVTSICNQNP